MCVYLCVKEHKENIAQRQCMRCSKVYLCVCVCLQLSELGKRLEGGGEASKAHAAALAAANKSATELQSRVTELEAALATK